MNKVVCERKFLRRGGGQKREKTVEKCCGERRKKKDELKYVLEDMVVTLDTSHFETSLLNAEA